MLWTATKLWVRAATVCAAINACSYVAQLDASALERVTPTPSDPKMAVTHQVPAITAYLVIS